MFIGNTFSIGYWKKANDSLVDGQNACFQKASMSSGCSAITAGLGYISSVVVLLKNLENITVSNVYYCDVLLES